MKFSTIASIFIAAGLAAAHNKKPHAPRFRIDLFDHDNCDEFQERLFLSRTLYENQCVSVDGHPDSFRYYAKKGTGNCVVTAYDYEDCRGDAITLYPGQTSGCINGDYESFRYTCSS